MNRPWPARSWLFVPGDSERKQSKVLGGSADALILDLEDSVAAAQLPGARRRVADLLARTDRGSQQLWVRVNRPSSPQLGEDLAAIAAGQPDGIVLPKVSCVAEIAEIGKSLAHANSIKILVIATETPRALLTLPQWDLAPVADRLAGLTWGMEDLGAALGATGKTEADGSLAFTFELARSMCLLAAAAAALPAVEGIHADFRDRAGLARAAARARRDGFSGMLAIHPDQVDTINAAFNPSAAEIERARQIVAAFAAEPDVGVTSLDGQMLDRPHLLQAQRVLATARRGEPSA